MATRHYAGERIEEIADLVRKELDLTVSVTTSSLLEALKRLGIKITPKDYCDLLKAEVVRHSKYDFEIYYRPDWSDKTLLWNLSAALGEILLGDFSQDNAAVYTGEYQFFTESGYKENIHKLLCTASHFENSITSCTNPGDLRAIIEENTYKDSYLNYFVQTLYDFYTDTLIRIQVTGGKRNHTYYLKFPKIQDKENADI